MRILRGLRGNNKNGRDLNSSGEMRCPYCHGTRIKLVDVHGYISLWKCKDAAKYPEKHAYAKLVERRDGCHWMLDKGNVNDTRAGGYNLRQSVKDGR